VTPLWFVPAAVLIAGVPFVAMAIARVAAEIRTIRRSITRLADDLASASGDLRSSTVGFRTSFDRFDRVPLRRRA